MHDRELGRDRPWRKVVYRAVGMSLAAQRVWRSRDERGLSQSTENAVLLTGAVAVAVTVVGIVGTYVAKRLGALE